MSISRSAISLETILLALIPLVDFNPQFPGRHSGPLPDEQRRIKLHLFVDWSSVEVFGNDGRTVITERIFPSNDSDGVALYAKGGAVKLISLDIWPLQSIWTRTNGAAEPGR
jgi:fructan beta-fructosidase